MAELPGLNWNIRQSLDRLKMQADIYNAEFVQHIQLMIGHPEWFVDPSFGIVTPLDPSLAETIEDTPFRVTENAVNNETIDVTPGLAVTQSGMWVALTETVRQIELSDPSIGVANVIYLRYIVEIADQELNDYGEAVVPYTARMGSEKSISPQSDQINVDTVDVYLNYDADTRADYIPLCIVTMQSVQDPVSLQVEVQPSFDHTRDSYVWNRPWFSARDVQHREQVGSGPPTDNNPHGISQNDLAVGAFAPYELHLDHGIIISDDRSIEKIPGVRCQVSVPYNSLQTDDGSGTYTTYPNAKYVELPNFPVRLGRCWIESSSEDWAAEIVAETNRVVFPYDPPVDEAIGMYYTKVVAGEPPAGRNEVTFSTNNPEEDELVIAGGRAFTQLSSTQEPFADAQKFPMVYELLIDNEGALIKAPQVFYCYKRLEAIGVSDTFSISFYGPSRVCCGLADATSDPNLSVKIRLYGKDSSGTAIEHLFEFGATWQTPGPIPRDTLEENALQVTDVLFAEVDQFIIEERQNDGPNSAIMMWALINPYDTYDNLHDACHIAEVMWDGIQMAKVRDKRIVDTTVREYLNTGPEADALTYLANSMAGGNETVYLEDFRRPRYHDQIPNTERDATALSKLPVNNISKLRPGAYGQYVTRALVVRTNSGPKWRIVLVPLQENRTDFYPTYQDPPQISFHNGTAWQPAVTATPVSGQMNTYEADLGAVPTMVKVHLTSAEYTGMLLFG